MMTEAIIAIKDELTRARNHRDIKDSALHGLLKTLYQYKSWTNPEDQEDFFSLFELSLKVLTLLSESEINASHASTAQNNVLAIAEKKQLLLKFLQDEEQLKKLEQLTSAQQWALYYELGKLYVRLFTHTPPHANTGRDYRTKAQYCFKKALSLIHDRQAPQTVNVEAIWGHLHYIRIACMTASYLALLEQQQKKSREDYKALLWEERTEYAQEQTFLLSQQYLNLHKLKWYLQTSGNHDALAGLGPAMNQLKLYLFNPPGSDDQALNWFPLAVHDVRRVNVYIEKMLKILKKADEEKGWLWIEEITKFFCTWYLANPSLLEQQEHEQLHEALFRLWRKAERLTAEGSVDNEAHLQSTLSPLADYEHLRTARQALEQDLDPLKQHLDENRDVLQFQSTYSQAVTTYYHNTLAQIEHYLGPPPCHFVILAKGSTAAGRIAPGSDIELLIITEQSLKEGQENYFKQLIHLFVVHGETLGDESRSIDGEVLDSIAYSRELPEDPQALEEALDDIDSKSLIIDIQTFLKMRLKKLATHTTDEANFSKYWSSVLYSSTATDPVANPSFEVVLCQQVQQQILEHGAEYRNYGVQWLKKHSQDYLEKKETLNSVSHIVDIKIDYLAPLIYCLQDIALIFNQALLAAINGMPEEVKESEPEASEQHHRKTQALFFPSHWQTWLTLFEKINLFKSSPESQFIQKLEHALIFLEELRLKQHLAYQRYLSGQLEIDQYYRHDYPHEDKNEFEALTLTSDQQTQLNTIQTDILWPLYWAMQWVIKNDNDAQIDVESFALQEALAQVEKPEYSKHYPSYYSQLIIVLTRLAAKQHLNPGLRQQQLAKQHQDYYQKIPRQLKRTYVTALKPFLPDWADYIANIADADGWRLSIVLNRERWYQSIRREVLWTEAELQEIEAKLQETDPHARIQRVEVDAGDLEHALAKLQQDSRLVSPIPPALVAEEGKDEKDFPEEKETDIRRYYLNPALIDCILDSQQQIRPKPAGQTGRHTVHNLLLDGKPRYVVKVHPEQAGTEISVGYLIERICGVGLTPNYFILKLHHKDEAGQPQTSALLLMNYIKGKDLQTLCEDAESSQTLNQIHTYSFLQHLIRVFLTNPEDDQNRDYFLQDKRLIRIDNERVWFDLTTKDDQVMVKQHTTKQSKSILQVKSFLFCLEQMKEIYPFADLDIHSQQVITNFLQLDRYEILSDWLKNDVVYLTHHFLSLFTQDEFNRHIRLTHPGASLLAVYFKGPYLFKHLYHNWNRLSDILEAERMPIGLGLNLLADIYSDVKKEYLFLFDQNFEKKFDRDRKFSDLKHSPLQLKRFRYLTDGIYDWKQKPKKGRQARQSVFLTQSSRPNIEAIRGSLGIHLVSASLNQDDSVEENALLVRQNSKHAYRQAHDYLDMIDRLHLDALESQTLQDLLHQRSSAVSNLKSLGRSSKRQQHVLEVIFRQLSDQESEEDFLQFIWDTLISAEVKFKDLEFLPLFKTVIDDNSLENFLKINTRETLDISGCAQLTDGIFRRIASVYKSVNSPLRQLIARNCNLMNIRPFSTFGEIDYLDLQILDLADNPHLKTMQIKAPALQELNLSNCQQLAAGHILVFARKSSELKQLTLSNNQTLKYLIGEWKSLQSLTFFGGVLQTIKIQAPQLKLLQAKTCPTLTTITTESKELSEVDCQDNPNLVLTSELANIDAATTLNRLQLSGCKRLKNAKLLSAYPFLAFSSLEQANQAKLMKILDDSIKCEGWLTLSREQRKQLSLRSVSVRQDEEYTMTSLLTMLKNNNAAVRVAAYQAIGALIQLPKIHRALFDQALKSLLSGVLDTDQNVREAVYTTLAILSPEPNLPSTNFENVLTVLCNVNLDIREKVQSSLLSGHILANYNVSWVSNRWLDSLLIKFEFPCYKHSEYLVVRFWEELVRTCETLASFAAYPCHSELLNDFVPKLFTALGYIEDKNLSFEKAVCKLLSVLAANPNLPNRFFEDVLKALFEHISHFPSTKHICDGYCTLVASHKLDRSELFVRVLDILLSNIDIGKQNSRWSEDLGNCQVLFPIVGALVINPKLSGMHLTRVYNVLVKLVDREFSYQQDANIYLIVAANQVLGSLVSNANLASTLCNDVLIRLSCRTGYLRPYFSPYSSDEVVRIRVMYEEALGALAVNHNFLSTNIALALEKLLPYLENHSSSNEFQVKIYKAVGALAANLNFPSAYLDRLLEVLLAGMQEENSDIRVASNKAFGALKVNPNLISASVERIHFVATKILSILVSHVSLTAYLFTLKAELEQAKSPIHTVPDRLEADNIDEQLEAKAQALDFDTPKTPQEPISQVSAEKESKDETVPVHAAQSMTKPTDQPKPPSATAMANLGVFTMNPSRILNEQGKSAALNEKGESSQAAEAAFARPSSLYQKLIETLEKSATEEAIRRSLNEKEVRVSVEKMQARASHFGYRCLDVKRDGRCFYHALILQLSRINPVLYQDLTVQVCLEKIAQHIIENQDFYEQFIHQAQGMNLDTFLDTVLKNDGAFWADDILISAAARTFNVDLVIVPNNGNCPSVFRRRSPEGLVYLGHEVEQHYQALEQDPTLESQETLEAYWISSQVDELESAGERLGLG